MGGNSQTIGPIVGGCNVASWLGEFSPIGALMIGQCMGVDWLLELYSMGELMGVGCLMLPNISFGFIELKFGWIGVGLIGVEFMGVA